MAMLENGMTKDLKHTRHIDHGVLKYIFKTTNIIPYLERVTGLPAKHIRNRLDTIVNCGK